MNSLPRFAALGAVLALVALVAGFGVTPASATPVSLTINGTTTTPQTVTTGSSAVIIATYLDEGGELLLTSTAAASVGYFATGASLTQNNDAQTITPNATQATSITVTDDADATAETTSLLASFTCVGAGSALVYYTQAGAVSSIMTITCSGASGASTITFSTSNPAVGSAVTVSAVCTAAGQALTASLGSIISVTSNGAYVSAQQANCTAAGTMVLTYICGSTANVTFTLSGATALLYCGTTAGTSLTVTPSSAAIGSPVTVSGACSAAGQPLTATTGGYFLTTATNGTYVSAQSINCVAAGTLSATFYCSTAVTVTLTLNGATGYAYCGGSSSTGTLTLSATTGTSVTVSGVCTAGAVMTQTGPAAFTSATLNGGAVTTTVAAGTISCTTAGTLVATLACNTAGTVYVALGSSTATFSCSGAGSYNPYAYNPYSYCGTAGCANTSYQQTQPATPSSLTLTSSAGSVNCGGTSAITVRVAGSNGQMVPDGTSVTLSSSMGTLSPSSAATLGGAVQATFNAPPNGTSGTAMLKATAGAATNSTGVSVSCTAAPPALPAQPPPGSQGTYAPLISPPSTGDAGLKGIEDACSNSEVATVPPA